MDQHRRPISRRDLFRGMWSGRAAAPAGVPGPNGPPTPAPSRDPAVGRRVMLPVHRPPGSVDEAAFLAGCTKCGACVEACPRGAIVPAPAKFREGAGTPMIDPYTSACAMCPDTPCISACEAGVLRGDRSLKMGVAWIQPLACLAHQGSFCTVCAERCPVPGAIRLSGGKASIDPGACTGCGTCAFVCPAPSNAVVVMPLADRPSADREVGHASPAPRDAPV